MSLKAQDVLVLLKLAAHRDRAWSYPGLGIDLGMSSSEVHAAIKRAVEGGLFHMAKRAARQGLTRGMPTSHAAPPLKAQFRGSQDLPPVWPDPEGPVRGEALEPLYKSVPHAARVDAELYEWLALVDAVRAGRARERELAKELRALGFREDSSDGAPMCRWRVAGAVVDVMPDRGDVLNFGNRWYADAITCAIEPTVDGGSFKIVSDAFAGRGNGDLRHCPATCRETPPVKRGSRS